MSGWNWLGRMVVLLGAWLLTAAGVLAGVDSSPARPQGSSQPTNATIPQLIEQLGDAQYHAREKAQEELRRLGTAAFDALLTAQDHADVEIAMRARYLVRSIAIEWVKPGDAPELKQLFRDYSTRDREERSTRAQHFATLDDLSGVVALCRIVRFDVDRILSKEAAVRVLNGKWDDRPEDRLRRAEVISAEIEGSTRPAADWLRLYARTLRCQSAAEDAPEGVRAAQAAELTEVETAWRAAVQNELEKLARHPEESNRHVATDLIRGHSQFLLRLGRIEEALASLRRSYDLLGDEPQELYEMLDWAIESSLHSVPDELAGRYSQPFQSDARLLYRLAESQLKRGDRELAEKTAAQARGLTPELLEPHLERAEFLQRRVLTDWAEQELRYVVGRAEPANKSGVLGRWMLADLLFDSGRSLAAAEALKPLVEVAAENPRGLEVLIDSDVNHLQGYMNYYFGMHYAQQGDRQKQQEYFRKAINAYPENPDFIIAMYRVPDADEAWRREVKQRIDAYVGELRTDIRAIESTMQQPMNDDDRNGNGRFLAQRLNELAWLISNTEGDMQDAVRMSQRSLELNPDYPAYLDTLGRCYYAAGDYKNAVKVQSRAVKLMPWMFVMRRQLELFESALAAQTGQQPPAPDAR